jgi:hypothetical protein
VYSALRKTFDVRRESGSFLIDDRGILRERVRQRHRSKSYWLEEAKARMFVGTRRICARGPAFFWCVATKTEGRYRQDRRLTEAEVAEWTKIDRNAREACSMQSR